MRDSIHQRQAAGRPTKLGRMRRRLTIMAAVETADDMGGVERSLTSIGAVWAQVEWLGGAEQWSADRFEQRGRLRITLRHRAGLEAGMHFVDGANHYLIRAVGDPDGNGRKLVCLCEEISP